MSKQKSVVSIRVENTVQERVETYQEENDLSEADAYRELIRRGLEASDCEERIKEIDERIQHIETQTERTSIIDRIF